MTTDPDILDRNVSKLIRHAYRPVTPGADYSARLRRQVLALADLRAKRSRRTRGRRIAGVAAAALVVLAIGAVARFAFFDSREAPSAVVSVEAILADGRAAIRADEEEWRAVTLAEVRDGVAIPGESLELATPTDVSIDVRLPVDGEVSVSGDSRIRIETSASEASLRLDAGRVLASSTSDRTTLHVTSPEGKLAVVVGRLEAEYPAVLEGLEGASMRIRIEEGEANGDLGRGPEGVPSGTELWLWQGRAVRREGPPLDPPSLVDAGPSAEPRVETTDGPGASDIEPSDLEPTGEPDPEPVAFVRGRVLDAKTREPIEGALVLSDRDASVESIAAEREAVALSPLVTATTDEEGRFELPVVRSGQQIVRACHRGFAVGWSRQFGIEEGADVEGIEVGLDAGGRIEGQLTRDDGEPWPASAIVAILIERGEAHRAATFSETTTDGEGRYAFERLAPGMYIVVFGGQRIVSAEVRSGETTRVDLPGQGGGVRLFGVVRRGDGSVVPGATISLSPATGFEEGFRWIGARSGADGSYEIQNVQPGVYDVLTGVDQRSDMSLQTRVEVPIALDLELDVRLGESSIEGRVTDRESGDPMPMAVMVAERIDDGAGTVTFAAKILADMEGRYAIPNMHPGLYRLTAYSMSGTHGQSTIDRITLPEAFRKTEVDFELSLGGSLLVRTVDADDETPLDGIRSLFRDPSGREIQLSERTRTDRQGVLGSRGLQAGRWTVTVRSEEFQEVTRPIDVEPGGRHEWVVRLERKQ